MMKTVVAAVLVFALSVVPLSAQTIQSIDLGSLGFGLIGMPYAIETDGDHTSQEWLISNLVFQRKILKVRADGVMCSCLLYTSPSPRDA